MGIIGSIRKHSGVAVTIVGLAIVAFIIGDLSKNKGGMPEVGKIDGQVISRQHFDMLFEEHEQAAKQQYLQYTGSAQLPAGAEYELRDQVWQRLMQETLVGHEMDKLGISVSNEELSDMYLGEFIHPTLRQVFANPQTGEYNKQYVKSVLDNFENIDSAAQIQLNQIKKQVIEDRAMNKYGVLMTQSFYLPNAIVKKIAEVSTKSSDVRVARMAYQSVSDDQAVPSDADFQAYYDQHKNEYKVLDEFRILEYVLFRIAPSQADMQAIQEEVAKLWEEMKETPDQELGFFVTSESGHNYDSTFRKASDFATTGLDSLIASASAGTYFEPRIVGNQWVMGKLIATQMRPDSLRASAIYVMNSKFGNNITRSEEQAEALRDSINRLIKAGMPFDTAVVRFSDNKENMGDMNWALDGGYGFLNEEIVKHAVGDVFTYDYPNKAGHLIVKVTGKTTPSKKYRVAVVNRPIVPSAATTKNIYNQASMFASQNRSAEAMEAAVREQNLMMNNTQVFAMSHVMDGHNNVREIVRWAFEKDTKKGEVSDQVFSLEDNAYAVVAVKDIVKEGIPTLEQLREDGNFQNYVKNDKKAAILIEKAKQAKGNDIEAAAAKLGTTVDTVLNVNFANLYFDKFGAEPRVIGNVAQAQNGAYLGPIKGQTGVYMVKVDNQNTVEADVDAARAQIEQLYSQKLNKLVMMLKDNAKVVDNRAIHF